MLTEVFLSAERSGQMYMMQHIYAQRLPVPWLLIVSSFSSRAARAVVALRMTMHAAAWAYGGSDRRYPNVAFLFRAYARAIRAFVATMT